MEMLQGVWKQHLRPRAVVGYGVKIFLPSPPNYVTRSPGLCLSPQILHKLCFQFLLGLTNGPKRIHKQCLCKILGDNEEYYGFFFRNGLLNFILKQTLKNMLIGHESENAL